MPNCRSCRQRDRFGPCHAAPSSGPARAFISAQARCLAGVALGGLLGRHGPADDGRLGEMARDPKVGRTALDARASRARRIRPTGRRSWWWGRVERTIDWLPAPHAPVAAGMGADPLADGCSATTTHWRGLTPEPGGNQWLSREDLAPKVRTLIFPVDLTLLGITTRRLLAYKHCAG